MSTIERVLVRIIRGRHYFATHLRRRVQENWELILDVLPFECTIPKGRFYFKFSKEVHGQYGLGLLPPSTLDGRCLSAYRG